MGDSDAEFMQAALQQAQLAADSGEAPVGAVLVTRGAVVAAGHNRTLLDHDPSGHAEVVVLRQAAKSAGNHRLVGATLYVTLEPCAMCVGTIVQARIARVVFGAYDQKAGALGSVIDLSDSAAFNHRFEIQGGLLADESAAILQAFFAARR
jgi:tRNA(adenine34) deaminase